MIDAQTIDLVLGVALFLTFGWAWHERRLFRIEHSDMYRGWPKCPEHGEHLVIKEVTPDRVLFGHGMHDFSYSRETERK